MAVGCAAAALVWSGSAHAQEGGRSLGEATTVVSIRCLEKQRLVARTVEWLGGSVIEPKVSAVVEETPSGIHIVIRRVDDVVGERTLELSTAVCAEVEEAAALAFASALDGKLVPAPTQGSGGTPPSAETLPPPLRPPRGEGRIRARSTAPNEAARAPEKKKGNVAVTVAVDVGMLAAVLPEVAMGFEPALELTLEPWLDLRAAGLFSQRITVSLLDEGRLPRGYADVDLIAGRADACFARSLGRRPRLRVCGGAVAGVVDTDERFDDRAVTTAPWVAASMRLDVRFDAAEGFGIGLAVEGFVPVVRPDLVVSVDGRGSAGFPEAGVAAYAGPSYRF